VLEARHGVDALQVIDETKRHIDLVMTDLMMPQMSGRELIPELQALSKPPRVVLMSGGQTVMRRTAFHQAPDFSTSRSRWRNFCNLFEPHSKRNRLPPRSRRHPADAEPY